MAARVMTPSTRFVRSVAANLAYWRGRMEGVDESWVYGLDSERQNLYRAAEFGLGLSETWRDTAELILQTYLLVQRRGYWREWIPLAEGVVAICGEEDQALKGQVLGRLGEFYRLNRQLDASLAAHLEEEKIGLALNDVERQSLARLCLGKTLWRRREHHKAEAYARAALDGFRSINAKSTQLGATYSILGLIARARGDLSLAEEHLGKSTLYYEESVDPTNLARSFKAMAVTQEEMGKVEIALSNYKKALKLLEKTDAELEKSLTELSLGTLYYNQGRFKDAEAAYIRANSDYLRRSGNAYSQSIAALNLGNVYLALGDLDKAERYLLTSIDLCQQAEAKLMLANNLGTLGETYLAMKKFDKAQSYFEEALAIVEMFEGDHRARQLHQEFSEGLNALKKEAKEGPA